METQENRDIGDKSPSSKPDPEIKKAQDDTSQAESKKHEKHERTPGLKIFDVFLYPIVTNLGVFAISVAATYLTSRGADRLPNGTLKYGEVGNWFQKRGDWLTSKLKSKGLSQGQADMTKMVAFSFADGSLMAPVVKVVEDHREHIGKRIDKALKKCPDDDAVYKAEPKQSWLSVLGGRFVTAGIVVPTAVALDKTGLNDKLFIEPGKKLGAWIAKTPSVSKYFGKLDVKEIGKIAIFEAFYTSVCTAGLYVSSRFIAHKTEHRHHKHKHHHNTVATDEQHVSPDTEKDSKWSSKVRKTHENETSYASRVSSAPEMSLGL